MSDYVRLDTCVVAVQVLSNVTYKAYRRFHSSACIWKAKAMEAHTHKEPLICGSVLHSTMHFRVRLWWQDIASRAVPGVRVAVIRLPFREGVCKQHSMCLCLYRWPKQMPLFSRQLVERLSCRMKTRRNCCFHAQFLHTSCSMLNVLGCPITRGLKEGDLKVPSVEVFI
jgi:hypothetical protein